MNIRILSSLLLLTSLSAPATAMDAACEPFIAAAEKSTQQPQRHSVSVLDGDQRIEAIVIDGRAYSAMNGQWRALKLDLLAAERELNAEIRSGRIGLGPCKSLGKETVDGVATSVLLYTLTMPGAPPATGKAYIGADGLVYALSADGQKVRYRYSGVSAPKL